MNTVDTNVGPTDTQHVDHIVNKTQVDTVINNEMYPGIIRFGGNTGKTNSFVGIDTGDLTGGVFNGASLADG